MKLKRFLLRYYPPGIILEYETQGELRQKAVDLLTLTPETDTEVLVNQIVRQESLISEQRKPQLRKLIYKLCAHFFFFFAAVLWRRGAEAVAGNAAARPHAFFLF